MKLEEGIKVSVVKGPFENYSGRVVNISSDGLVQVSLDLIGQGLIATFLKSELGPYRKSPKNKYV